MRAAVTALGIALVMSAACGTDNASQSDAIRLTVPRGANLTSVADTLQRLGIIRSARLFRLYAKATGKESGIQAGTYDFVPRTPMRQVLRTLSSGRETLVPLSVPEGLMLSELADRVQSQLGIPADEFSAAARDPALLSRLGLNTSTLEGYLYPSTYHVRIGATAQDVVEHMVTEFENQWQPSWDSTRQLLGLSRHELVTLASIIEGEVRYAPDRRYVSSVYHNRLARGMRLQADPTVIYALGRRRRLYQRDYRTPSPYNTYLIDGLPPGPIGQPSAASIDAALSPITTDFLYFVARPDGKHVFSRTHRDHLAATREVRQMEADSGPR